MFGGKLFKTVILCLFCIAVTLCGCKKKEDAIDVSDSESSYITFAWWGNDVRHSYTMEAVSEFERLNPDITVNCKYGIWDGYSKIQNIYMMSKEIPDVMQINYAWIKDYSPDGEGFYDLNELSDIIDLSNYTENELEYGMSNGKLNALPIAFNSQTIYYNKDLYDKYGVDIPKNWEDLFNAAKIMNKDGIYPLSMGDKPLFMICLTYLEQTTGVPVCDDNGNLDLSKEDIGIMLDFYKRLFDEKVMMPVDDYDVNSFSTGKTAGTVGWVSDISSICDNLIKNGANVVVGDHLKREDAKLLGWYVKPATMYAISKTTENPEASAKLLNYLLNSEEMALYQGTEKGIPISRSAYKVLEENDMISEISEAANELIVDNQDELEIMKPAMEQGDLCTDFKAQADYYLYSKKSRQEVINMLYDTCNAK